MKNKTPNTDAILRIVSLDILDAYAKAAVALTNYNKQCGDPVAFSAEQKPIARALADNVAMAAIDVTDAVLEAIRKENGRPL
jgi:hypothetical protein